LSFLVAMALMGATNMRFSSILEEVNRRLPKDAQISVSGTRWKFFDVLGLHAQMHPESAKRRQMWVLFLFGAISLFGGFIASWYLPPNRGGDTVFQAEMIAFVQSFMNIPGGWSRIRTLPRASIPARKV
jgi:hypothetical protein